MTAPDIPVEIYDNFTVGQGRLLGRKKGMVCKREGYHKGGGKKMGT